jgi:hypothetical protein
MFIDEVVFTKPSATATKTVLALGHTDMIISLSVMLINDLYDHDAK